MASANGVLSVPIPAEPPTSPSTQSAKRKREDAAESLANGVADSNSESTGDSFAASKSMIRDLIDVLKGYDPIPSILERPIAERPSSSGPQAKRQKAEDKATQRSILTRLSEDSYKNVDEVLEDIDNAVSGIMESLRLPEGSARLSGHQSEISLKVKAFKQQAHDLVKREKTLQEDKQHSGVNGTSSTKYNVDSALSSNSSKQVAADDNKMVLTLFGSAPGARQLFSSLQIPPKRAGEQRDIIQTLREVGLPNGITATHIVPAENTGLSGDKKRVPTLSDLFPTPRDVPVPFPPKPSKLATTRSATVGWYQPSASEPLPRSASYSRQTISCGHWLDYSNVSASSQGTKRKRDRALSLVGAKAPTDVEPVESEAAKLDALFRSAYSGFAPTKDDAAAVAPAGVLSRMWWQQVGEKSFEKLVETMAIDKTMGGSELSSNKISESSDELAEFENMVEELENDGIDPSLVPLESVPEKSAEEKDVEEILQGISELLETLNSYQRIRHMSLNSASRPAGLLSVPDTTSLGTPTKPSEPEQATYEILKSQLTLMIATLPPYAVAKLDPDRLADLSISTKIEVQLNDYKGVMDEDEAAAKIRAASQFTASSSTSRAIPPASIHRTSSTSLYGNQYATSRPVPTPASQYYGATQTPIRPPSANMQRPPATAPVGYQPQRTAVPAAAAYRPAQSYGTPTYQHQAARPVSQSYGSATQQHSSGQPYMQPPSQSYQHVPQTLSSGQINGRYPAQPGYPHQTPTPQNGMQYRYPNGANFPRQSSPQKPAYSPQPTTAQVQTRPAYSTPTPPMPQDRPYLQTPMGQPSMGQPTAMNGTPGAPTQHQTSNNLTQYRTFMTQEQQSNMMERQRSLLAAQQQETQQNARNAAMGNASNGQVNGTSAVAAGL
ncbi:uncharacterized protein LY89DRAFT_783748 [Mollisia scopiformis]|uniref:Uncharacterized protein n=1 Tax=Mollisia scopiformis TaxID=149040 RepID=A0A194X3A0_MOLSC|nr:uncharacterized protein LY89DRAFT_783748 [Mollisia scopiformis]KUJ14651.1 hypothetical protein LY89DRAFT_783748 [Mollisia scopiformis]